VPDDCIRIGALPAEHARGFAAPNGHQVCVELLSGLGHDLGGISAFDQRRRAYVQPVRQLA